MSHQAPHGVIQKGQDVGDEHQAGASRTVVLIPSRNYARHQGVCDRQAWSLPSQTLQQGGKQKTKIRTHHKADEDIPDTGNHRSRQG